ncbi:exodeoxyribonuclease III [Actinomyces glycerinitolerans]|uniref:Endonuclease/exonuclease/phosphatase n=1 Tax=Actinomyces glycerinitolerans TaxID=1892869 RepID=A0A1M4RWB5_9ACTO|nr:exodeoxyribonuclease III [Actinomyces glycerinitolerans]SHE24219.1 endonuclease/exonuclease/phosphatase [Actinomyces glycerinitolerans]
MRVATINVNGIRAAARKHMDSWLESSAPDVLLVQEVRADETTAAALLPGYESVIWPCRVKGRAGVAVAVRQGAPVTVGAVRRGVSTPESEEPDVDSGRWLEMDLTATNGTGARTPLTVVSAYFHSGQVGTIKMDQKYAHLNLVDARMTSLLASAAAGGPQVLMAGDLNIVRSERDIKNWRPNHNKSAGVLDEEIAYLERWFGAGWVDVARSLAPDAQGPYTWWSQRGKAFDNDAGWRIDYQVATPQLAGRARAFTVDRAPSYAERWSDHAPLVVDYDL